MKIVIIGENHVLETDFDREVNAMRKYSDLRISEESKYTNKVDYFGHTFGIIVGDRMIGTLDQLLLSGTNDVRYDLNLLLEKIQNIVPNEKINLSLQNIGYIRHRDGSITFKLVDFSCERDDSNRVKEIVCGKIQTLADDNNNPQSRYYQNMLKVIEYFSRK